MNIKILTPEKVIFEGEVDSVQIPGVQSEFHIKQDHAAIVSALKSGNVKLYTKSVDDVYAKNFHKDSVFYTYPIKSGVIEFNHNKGIILCE